MSAKRIGDAVGDSLATRCLEAALVSHKLAHAYLLVGRDEDAKLALAAALAKSGNCRGEHGPGEFCDTCPSCRQVDSGGSPNMRVFGDSGTLSIDTVDQFISYASVKTASGCLKVSVFRGVDFFTDVAADRVLKTIEEPVPGNIFLLLSQNSRRVLPTIRSRAQIMKVERGARMVDLHDVTSATGADTSLEVLLDFARANVSLSETVGRLLRMRSQNSLRDNATAGLQTLALFMNSVLRARGKVPPLAGVSLSTEPELARVNFVLDESRVGLFLDHLGERLKHVEQNVNPELVLTNALLELRRMTTHE
ncbi:MAG: hypothetical protein NTV26_04720 [Caldiserica bacterium]|nr:hypothetical protein [Caldisericota bacterium]